MLLSTLLRGVVFFGLSIPVVADDFANLNPSGEGCVDPQRFLSCYEAQISLNTKCVDRCNSTITNHQIDDYQKCVTGCSGQWLAGNIGCWVQGCWNEAFSCAYQLTALHYFSGQNILLNGNVPWFPPPDGVSTGACVCNLGHIWGNLTATPDFSVCSELVSLTDFAKGLSDCECCAMGWRISNAMNACPNNNLTLLGFPDAITTVQEFLKPESKDNCAIIDINPKSCATDYGFPWIGPDYYNPLNLPASQPGTEPLSDLAGDSYTEFGASIFTMSLYPNFVTTITPAAYVTTGGSGGGGAGGGAGSASGVVTQTGGQITVLPTATGGSVINTAGTTATASGNSPAATTKTGAGPKLAWSRLLTLGMFIVTFII